MKGDLKATGEAGRRHVLDGGFTWEAIVPRYEAILEGRSGPGSAGGVS